MTPTVPDGLKHFFNNFGRFSVPLAVWIEPSVIAAKLQSSCPQYLSDGLVMTVNTNNGLAHHDFVALIATAKTFGTTPPKTPEWKTINPANIDAYYNACTPGGGFAADVDPRAYGLPGGVGGPDVPAVG